MINTAEALAKLPDTVNLGHIQTLHIGARLYRSIPRDQLFSWIAGLAALRYIHLSDDWIADDQMSTIASEFAEAFPSVDFEWSFEGLAGGKHGR